MKKILLVFSSVLLGFILTISPGISMASHSNVYCHHGVCHHYKNKHHQHHHYHKNHHHKHKHHSHHHKSH